MTIPDVSELMRRAAPPAWLRGTGFTVTLNHIRGLYAHRDDETATLALDPADTAAPQHAAALVLRDWVANLEGAMGGRVVLLGFTVKRRAQTAPAEPVEIAPLARLVEDQLRSCLLPEDFGGADLAVRIHAQKGDCTCHLRGAAGHHADVAQIIARQAAPWRDQLFTAVPRLTHIALEFPVAPPSAHLLAERARKGFIL